jgi:SAM-dependent methyltransferase
MNALVEPTEISVVGSYEDVASEYYDSVRHPTCANFREASDLLLNRWFEEYTVSESWISELGPGSSSAAPHLINRGQSLDHLVLVDSSSTMLSYSREWSRCGAHFVIGDASTLPLRSEYFGLIVSSLGDPYNTSKFWKETSRVLRSGGYSFFTTPSYDWAVSFREYSEAAAITAAEFELLNGSRLAVSSLIYPVSRQQMLIEAEGLRLDQVAHVSIAELSSTQLSSKLILKRGMNASIVTGYVISKP